MFVHISNQESEITHFKIVIKYTGYFITSTQIKAMFL